MVRRVVRWAGVLYPCLLVQELVRQRLKLTCSFYAFGHSLRVTVILLFTRSSFPGWFLHSHIYALHPLIHSFNHVLVLTPSSFQHHTSALFYPHKDRQSRILLCSRRGDQTLIPPSHSALSVLQCAQSFQHFHNEAAMASTFVWSGVIFFWDWRKIMVWQGMDV